MPKELYLIDGNSYVYRAFYALGKFPARFGKPVGAVYGFFNMLFKVIGEQRPDYLGVAFDHPAPTFRHKKFEDYKIHRPRMPEDLSAQFPLIKEIIKAMDIVSIERAGFEADDILATMAKKFESETEVFILTADKDIFQVVTSKIKIIDTHRENLIYNEEKVKERFGVNPEQIVDFMALAGDASDNIPGVPGVGAKTAETLIKEFGSLENLYKNLAGVKRTALRQLLETYRSQAELSRELAHLKTEIPLDFKLSDLEYDKFDKEKPKKIFESLGFNRLLKRLEELPVSK